MTESALPKDDYVISRNALEDAYSVWLFDPGYEGLLRRTSYAPKAQFDRTHKIAPIGRYLLEWGPVMLQDYQPCFPYRLFELDLQQDNPLMGPALQKGIWTKSKFWSYRADFGNPNGAKESYDSEGSL